MRTFVSLSCSRQDDRLAGKRLVLGLVPSRSGAQGRLVLCLVPSKRAFTTALSPFGRGVSPDGLTISFRLQLVELSQLAQSLSGHLAQPGTELITRLIRSPETAGDASLLHILIEQFLNVTTSRAEQVG
jgi:hypothetical protein